MIIQIFILILGFIFLIKGADVFIDGASCTARHLRVSKMFVGLTIVAFGTSAPELAVSFKALISNSSDMVLGNVIGSNILNILLILGVGAMIHPIVIKHNTIKKEIPICIMITALSMVLIMDKILNSDVENAITRGDGLALILFFCVFLYYIFNTARNKTDNNPEDDYDIKYSIGKSISFVVIGLLAIIYGSNMVVESASFIARHFGISERIISLTIIAIGTSLPELATAISSSIKREQDILVGNVIGSNIFNIGVVLGLPVAILGNISANSFNYIDIIFFLISPLLLYFVSRVSFKINKLEGFSLILLFSVYYMLLFIF